MTVISTSKVLLLFVMLSYFVGLVVGIYFVYMTIIETPEYSVQALMALFSYIGAPVAVTIGFYSWKAKAENMIILPREIVAKATEKNNELNNMINKIGEE